MDRRWRLWSWDSSLVLAFESKNVFSGDFVFETWSHIARAGLELVVDAGLESLILLPPPLKWWDHSFLPEILGIKFRASCMLGKCSIRGALIWEAS